MALAFQQSLSTWLVPDLVRTFRAAHLGARFELTQVRDELHSVALDGGQADLEIGMRRPAPRPGSGHPRRGRDPRSLAPRARRR